MTTTKAEAIARSRRVWPLWLVWLLLAVLAWRVLGLGLADHLAARAPERALAWRADHPEALLRRAEALAGPPAPAVATVTPGQAEQVAALARAALRADPLDGHGYRLLGQVADDPAKAFALHDIAARRSPRDPSSQFWLADHYLARGELSAALRHLDTLQRLQPTTTRWLQPLLTDLAMLPEAHEALAERLSTAPWADAVLVYAIREAPDRDAIAPLIDRLRKSPPGLSTPVLNAWLDRLARDGLWSQAYLTWANQLPEHRLLGLGNLYNGGFEWEPGQGGFDWRFGRIAGATVSLLPTAGAGGERALRVHFTDRRIPFAHVRQQLALSPGRYRLSGNARSESLRSLRGLAWSLQCATPRGPPLGDSEPLRGDQPWHGFSLDFEVPAEGCDGQWLTLRHLARSAGEQRISGIAWYDDLRIVRLPPQTQRP